MLHLFAGISLLPDILSVIGGRSYLVTQFSDYEWNADKELLKAQFQSEDRAIAYVETYSDMVGKGKQFANDVEFFEDVYEHAWGRPHVFADMTSYALIACKYIKLMLPRASRETAYRIYKLSLDKFYIKYVYLQNLTSGFMLVDPVNLMNNLKRLNKNDFLFLFDKTKVTGGETERTRLRNKLRGEGSTEYQIATTLLGDDQYNDYLTYQFKNVILRHIRGMIKEIQGVLLPNIYNVEGNSIDTDLYEAIQKADLSDVILSTDVVLAEKTKDFTTVVPIVDRVVAYFSEHRDDLRWDGQNVKEAETYTNFQWLADMLRENVTAKDIINECLGTREASYYGDLLYTYSGRDQINLMMLFYIYSLYTSGNTEELKEFTMED